VIAGEQFGTLVDIEPRLAWEREDQHFTPWLADNLDRLALAIGIPLELVGREHVVGRYAADVLASNPETGKNVLIENQLEWSDHRHLGQIMTYLAGIEAETIIWIARSFRDEHLSALRWLNQYTDERFSFFAVQLRVVQIGSSPLAPLFDVVEKPNKWERSLHQTTQETVNSDVGWRRLFWDRYLQKFPTASTDRGGGGQGSSRWRSVPGSDLIVTRWIGEGAASVFVRGDRGVHTPEIYRRLKRSQDKLETLLGSPLGDNQWYPFEITKEFDLSDPVGSEQAIAWLEEHTNRLVSIISQNAEDFS
jgi:hypothetical protein